MKTLIAFTTAHLLALLAPVAALLALAAIGVDATRLLVVALTVTMACIASAQVVEAIFAWRVPRPPTQVGPVPPATVIVAAYLPNEVDVIVDTAIAALAIESPATVQVIVAYNSPRRLPVVAELHALAQREPRLLILDVESSTSKSANVNAALAHATGEIIGIFDADHRPRPDVIVRAWRWLGSGWDVVQGQCAVRNGARSRVARLVAPEFAAMYCVAHPGRARILGFGVFGGSNGYWRAEALRAVEFDDGALCEDIDASVRLLGRGGRIASDPSIVSDELAPESVRTLWHQRLRWAQGWFEVGLRRVPKLVADRDVPIRRRAGLVWLFAICPLVPWLAMIAPATLAWQLLRGGPTGVDALGVGALAVAITAGPLQALVAWRHSEPRLKARFGWWLGYVLVGSLVFGEFKNAASRVAHVRHIAGSREWRVTPRTVADRPAGPSLTHTPVAEQLRGLG